MRSRKSVGFVSMYAQKIFYLKIKIHRQFINIHEVTDFHCGFMTIFSLIFMASWYYVRFPTYFNLIHLCESKRQEGRKILN